jgi:hypothetical protein
MPVATPGDYSLTVYDPNGNVVYQVEQAAATINPSTIYELSAATSITVGSTSYLLENVSIFGSGAYEAPNTAPTAVYAGGGNPVAGPFDAIFGLVYNANTQIWNGNSINYFLGFSAGPPGVGTPYGPAGADTYDNEATGPFFSATAYLNPGLVTLGYTAEFYDPASVVPEPSSLIMTLIAAGVLPAVAGLRRLRKARAMLA